MKSLIVLLFFISSCNQEKDHAYKGHGTNSLDAETLKKYAPPTLSKDTKREIEKIMDVRSPHWAHPTSDGKTIYFNWSVSGTPQVWKWIRDKKLPTQLTAGEDRTSLKTVAPNDKYLVVSRDEGGSEYPGLYLLNSAGGPLFEIYKKNKTKVVFQRITSDSKYIYYKANDIDPKSYALYKFKVKTRTRELVFSQKGTWFLLDKLGDQLILGKSVGNISTEIYLYDEKSKTLENIFGKDKKGEYYARFLDNEKLVVLNNLGEYRSLSTYSIKEKKLSTLRRHPNMDIYSFRINRTRTRIFYRTLRYGRYNFQVIDTKTMKNIKLKIGFSNAAHRRYGIQSHNGRFTSMMFSFSDVPRKQYLYDWDQKKLIPIMDSSTPELLFVKHLEKIDYYKSGKKAQIPMFVKEPLGCKLKKCPVIVHLHGGPESLHLPGFRAGDIPFLRENFIIARPNVRGSDGHGKRWLNADNGVKRLEVIEDIKAVAEHFRSRGHKKIGVMGGSYGGYSTLYAMTKFAGTYDAGVARVGMSNLITFLKNTAEHRRHLREAEYGYLAKDEKFLKELSPMTYVEKLNKPLLILHGANDQRVPAGEAIQFVNKANANGEKVKLVLYPDEGHRISKRKNRVTNLSLTLDFFKIHLK